jgi:hypothetical protein
MNKIRLLTIAVIVLFLMNFAILSFIVLKPNEPFDGPPMGRGDENGPKKVIIERLNLNQEQVNAYENLIKTHQVDIKNIAQKIKVVKHKLFECLATDNVTEASKLELKLGTLQVKIEKTHYNHFADLKKLCEPNQIEKFNLLSKDLAKLLAPNRENPKQL